MEVKCPKCYKGNIKNGIAVQAPHGHPGEPEGEFPVGIMINGEYHQLMVDVCSKCGHVVRHYWV